jgi:Baseplate J-like protein
LLSNEGYQITPSATAIAEAQAILINTYGANVNLEPSSPNGLLVQNIAIAITQREADQADVIGSFNPNIASGLQLDAICANLDIVRIPAKNSTATCVFTGLTGVTITAGSQVANTTGDIFIVDTNLTIGLSGTITGTVTAQTAGTIAVTANTITTILTAINGWDTVNNPTAGNVGTMLQSDAELRNTRIDQLAFASAGSIPSIIAGVSALNPISFDVISNNTNLIVNKDGLGIYPHSIMLVLDGGGSDLEIATMLFNRLSGGGGMSGNKSFTIPIPNSPEVFTARWQLAVQQTLGLNITLKLGAVYPPNLTTVIADIINNNFNFNRIGKLIEATEFIYLLMNKGIVPIVSLTFNVGTLTELTEYTMPISDSIGGSILNSNVVLNYV